LSLQGLKGISDEALCAVLSAVKELPEDDDSVLTTRHISDFLKKEFSKVATKLRVTTSGGDFDWEVADISKMLQYFVKESDFFKELMGGVAGNDPTRSVLELIFYIDGITPGNVLRPDNRRKLWAFYCTFIDFGPHNICREEVWLPLAVLRHSIEHKLDGRVSCAARHLLNSIVESGQSGTFVNTTTPKVVFWRIGRVLADEEGLKSLYNSKGASGIKQCTLCSNVVSMSSNLSAEGIVCIARTNPANFQLHSDSDVWRSVDRVHAAAEAVSAGTMTKGAFEDLQKATGFTHCSAGVLLDVGLRRHLLPVTTFRYDWMHVFLSHGVLNHELHNLLTVARRLHRVGFKQLDEFSRAGWKWPASGKKLQDFFSEGRERASSDSFKAMASEVLVVYPLVRQFSRKVLQRLGGMTKELDSFYALCEVVDMLHGVKMGSKIEPNLLQNKLVQHGCLHQLAYGSDCVKPKHHFAFHIPLQLERDRMILDTFVLERKHQPIKQCAQHVKNTTTYERSVLSRVLVDQLRKLRAARSGDGLIGSVKRFGDTDVAKAARWKSCTVASGDVVILNASTFFEVRASICRGGQLFLAGHELRPRDRPDGESCRCQREENLVQVPLETVTQLQLAQAWAEDAGGVLILHSKCAVSR